MQVIRTKHKVKAFHIAAKAAPGCLASLSLAIGNNTLEVCTQSNSLYHLALCSLNGCWPFYQGMHAMASMHLAWHNLCKDMGSQMLFFQK